ncbi:MAG: hypothetical protein KJ052_20035 [Candidatus Hydrogenedentes bacterium]|nr:hypothetical protein [Candidatus Hydrogenedentota bacterium]
MALNDTRKEFESLRHGALMDVSGADLLACQIVKSWHRHPAVADVLWYHGINAGEILEYLYFQEVIPVVAAAAAGQPDS